MIRDDYVTIYLKFIMRDIARDVARGSNVLEMELVNHLDTLRHASPGENKITYGDTVFPTFLFLSGLGPVKPKRSATLVGLGLAYNWLQDNDKSKLRLFGVLQRIGLSGLLLEAAHGTTSIWFPTGCLALWSLVTYGLTPTRPYACQTKSAQGILDQQITKLLPWLKTYADGFDPEGLLGTLTSAASLWFGHWLSCASLSTKQSWILGTALTVLGTLTGHFLATTCPTNKPYWTPTFAVATSGIALLKLQTARIVVSLVPKPFYVLCEVLGKRSLEVYLLSAMVDQSLIRERLTKRVGAVASAGICASALSFAAWVLVNYNIRISV